MNTEIICKLKDFEEKLVKEFFNLRKSIKQETDNKIEFFKTEINGLDIKKLKTLQSINELATTNEDEEHTTILTDLNSIIIPINFSYCTYLIIFTRMDEVDYDFDEGGESGQEIKYLYWHVYRVENSLGRKELKLRWYDGCPVDLLIQEHVYEELEGNNSLELNDLKDNSDILEEISFPEPNIDIAQIKDFFSKIGINNVFVEGFDGFLGWQFYVTFYLDDIKIGFSHDYSDYENEISNSFINYLIIYSSNMTSLAYKEYKDIQKSLELPTNIYKETGLDDFNKDVTLVESIERKVKIEKISTDIQDVINILVPSKISGKHFEVIEKLNMLGLKNKFLTKEEVNPDRDSSEKGKRIDLVWYDPSSEEPVVAIEVTHSSEPIYDLIKMIELNPKICVIYTKKHKVIPFTIYFNKNKIFKEKLKPDLIIISPDRYSVFDNGILKKSDKIAH